MPPISFWFSSVVWAKARSQTLNFLGLPLIFNLELIFLLLTSRQHSFTSLQLPPQIVYSSHSCRENTMLMLGIQRILRKIVFTTHGTIHCWLFEPHLVRPWLRPIASHSLQGPRTASCSTLLRPTKIISLDTLNHPARIKAWGLDGSGT